jgi:hypothetical protein
MPGYKDVPEHYKHPVGPYRQAPAEFGGEWWLVSPFSGPEPWARQARPDKELPPGFEAIFGKRRDPRNYPSYQSYKVDQTIWDQELDNYVKPGPPDGVSQETVNNAANLTHEWGLGDLVFYLNKQPVLGWRAVWVSGPIQGFDLAADFVLNYTHHAIGIYQWEMLNRGITVPRIHPIVYPT